MAAVLTPSVEADLTFPGARPFRLASGELLGP